MLNARDSAQAKLTEATEAIQTGMYCKKHNRLCYAKYDGSCGVYTHGNVLEHAGLLVSHLYFISIYLFIFTIF